MRFEKGIGFYESRDEILRLEVRQKKGDLPRLVAIVNFPAKEREAELHSNLNRCGIEGGEPITQAFEGFLRKHNLVQPDAPMTAGKKKHPVAYVRRPPPGVHILCCT